MKEVQRVALSGGLQCRRYREWLCLEGYNEGGTESGSVWRVTVKEVQRVALSGGLE